MMSASIRILTNYLAVPALLWLLAIGNVLADPPGRAGRLSLLDGEVALRRADGGQWERPATNWPLTTGDALATQGDGRAELRIGSTVVRLDADTALAVVRLDDERIRMRLDEGAVYIRVRSRDPAAAVTLETADGIVTTAEPGAYRIEQVDGTTVMSTYRGHLDYRSETRRLGISEGRRAVVSRWSDEVEWGRPDRDEFYEWALARDERDERLGEPRYVSPEMTGAEDLYEYGEWDEHHDYGAVWYPRSVGYDWAPYRFGSWIWVAPWGWTWVDDAPWGFAPFHYGRWVRIGPRWAWVPGRRDVRPVYAPAVVGWIGAGGAVVTLTSRRLDNLRWYPLAPRDVYIPYYRYSPNYVRQINVTHITNVVEITRVVEAPHRARHAYRDHREAVNRVTESVLRPSRIVHIDSERRRERLIERARGRDFPHVHVDRRAPDGEPGRADEHERREWRREQREEERREQREEARQEERMRRLEVQRAAERLERRMESQQRLEERLVDPRTQEVFPRQRTLQRSEEMRQDRRREQAEEERRQHEGRELRREMQRREALQQEERLRRSEMQRAEQRQERRPEFRERGDERRELERREVRRVEPDSRPRERQMQAPPPSDPGERTRRKAHGGDGVPLAPDN